MSLMYRRYALTPVAPGQWRIWDTHRDQWLDKYGAPDDGTYYATSREVAAMRVRDLAEWHKAKGEKP